jgi:hypothetical protein
MTDAETLIKANDELRQQIAANQEANRSMKETIKHNERKLWPLCKHTWAIDHSCAFDDTVRRYCSKCGLWNNSLWYS